MEYKLNELEKNLKAGDVILSHSPGFVTSMIRSVTQSYWNHARMYIGNNKYIESDWTGVKIQPLSYLEDKDIAVYRHTKATPSTLEKICIEACSEEGKKYDFLAIIELLFVYLSGRKERPGKIGKSNKFICSELVALPYYDNGLPVLHNYDYDEIVPNDFAISRKFKRVDF